MFSPYHYSTPSDSLTPEVQKKVLDAFEVFDHEQNKTVDAREIGTIIRSLGTYVLFEAKYRIKHFMKNINRNI